MIAHHDFLYTRRFIQEKNPSSVKYVANPTVVDQDFIRTRVFIQERYPSSVKYVANPTGVHPDFIHIRGLIQERNLRNWKYVSRSCTAPLLKVHERIYTGKKPQICGKASMFHHDFLYTRAFTQEGNTTTEKYVAKPSIYHHYFQNARALSYLRETL